MQSQTLHIFSLRHKGCPKNFKKWKFFNKKSLLVSWTFLLKYCCYRCPNIGYRGRSYQRKSYFFFGKGLLSLSSYTKRVSKKSNFYKKKSSFITLSVYFYMYLAKIVWNISQRQIKPMIMSYPYFLGSMVF